MPLPDDLLQPIPGPNPSGENLRYDPLYDRIKEARREDLDVPQGDWQRTLKTADWPLVIQLAEEALRTRSKDLQLAAWLTEALLRQRGFAGLRDGLELLTGLIEQFWDTLHPELEDGDAEFRAAPLAWVGQYLELAVGRVPVNSAGHGTLDYLQSRSVPTEEEANDEDSKRDARRRALEAGKLAPEEFDRAYHATPKAWYRQLVSDVDGALAALDALDRTSDDRFGDDAPGFVRLRTALQQARHNASQLLAGKLAADPDPEGMEEESPAADAGHGPDAGGAEDGGPVETGPPAAVGARPAATAVPRTPGEAAGAVAEAARLLRAQSPADPAPYLMLRGYRWGELRRDPRRIDPRLLEAPPTELRSGLKSLLLEERWSELLESGEAVMAAPHGRGWLDLQRYAVTACDALGGDYDALGHALRCALRALLVDLPQLPDLALLDDSPTANADTRRWLQQEGVWPPAAGGAVEADAPVAGGAPGARDAQERAAALVRQGQMQRAVQLLLHEADREQSPRGRFLRRAQAASILVDASMEAVALPILDELLAQIDTHGLENWEAGETVALPLGLLHRCYSSLDTDSSGREALYVRICRLDPLRAIQLRTPAAQADGG